MAKKTIIKKAQLKKKKKRWISILADKEFNSMQIGETLVAETPSLIGKKVVVSLMYLTNEIKKQNTNVIFKIVDVRDDKAQTEIIGLQIVEAYIKRVVKRDREKIYDSFLATTKDNIKIRIKPLVMTRNKTKSSRLKELRRKIRDYVTEQVKSSDYDYLLNSILTNKLQKGLRENIKKIVPIAVSEIRIIKKL